MPDIPLALGLVLALVLAAEFVNGSTDAPNAIATVVSTRALSPQAAVLMAAVLNAVGVFSGTAVATTIGTGFVQTKTINLAVIAAAMLAIVTWSSLAWRYGLPTSESHALVASLTGAGFAVGGGDVLLWDGWIKVGLGLVFSTLLGFGGGFAIMLAVYRIFHRWIPSQLRLVFGRLQILSAGFMAFSHGSNDGQKFMGVFTLALMVSGILPISEKFQVPWWVILISSVTMAIGTALGGWRIIRTLGMRMVQLQPYEGFAAENGAATVIEVASRLGIPVSTTHTIGTSIMGVGSVRRLSGVRWSVAREVVAAWVLTFPVCAFIGWLAASVLSMVLG
ncbi:MAG: inorganic phosphate transporter [Chloroflexi bacterium]|nr:inorganic phosphate transporter [Chloroflexota bacterium]